MNTTQKKEIDSEDKYQNELRNQIYDLINVVDKIGESLLDLNGYLEPIIQIKEEGPGEAETEIRSCEESIIPTTVLGLEVYRALKEVARFRKRANKMNKEIKL